MGDTRSGASEGRGSDRASTLAREQVKRPCTSSGSEPVTFTSTSTDPDGDTLSCSWTFAGGTSPTSTDCTVMDVIFQ